MRRPNLYKNGLSNAGGKYLRIVFCPCCSTTGEKKGLVVISAS